MLSKSESQLVTNESIKNFTTGIIGDTFTGVLVFEKDNTPKVIHLAITSPLSKEAQMKLLIDQINGSRISTLNGEPIAPIEAVGGHSRIVNVFEEGSCRQVRPGIAEGPARGFTITKTGENAYEFFTKKLPDGTEEVTGYRSGLNTQDHPGDRNNPAVDISKELIDSYKNLIAFELDKAMKDILTLHKESDKEEGPAVRAKH